MSQGELKLATFPPGAADNAVALGNLPDAFRRWTPVGDRPQPISRLSVSEMGAGCMDDDALPIAGETSFLVNADPRMFGSGAAIAISYERNTELLECEENLALDGTGGGLRPATISLIVDRVQKKSGWRTNVELRTLADGSLDIKDRLVPLHGEQQVLRNPVALPAVALSSLQATHCLADYPHIFLVKTMLDPPSDIGVYKAFADDGWVRVEEVDLISRLPHVDFLLRPTHIVVDGERRLCGLLTPHHPASSLCLKMESLHPDVGQPVLPPSGADRSGCSLAGTPTVVAWLVKLAWVTDIAASVAWLHAQSVFWGDLKTENIVLCVDGHCRLIDYAPGGMTIAWSPPEAAQDNRPTAQGDVFALGLVLWAVAVEVGTFQRQEDYVPPLLVWNQEAPHWFQSLTLSCLEREPACRPSARRVYDALLACTWPTHE